MKVVIENDIVKFLVLVPFSPYPWMKVYNYLQRNPTALNFNFLD